MEGGTLAVLTILSILGSGVVVALGPMNVWDGGMMSPGMMGGCEAMMAQCPQDHAACEEYMSDPAHAGSIRMTPEECQAMHARMHEGMMSGGMMSGSCHSP